jgi:hypothetical protein
VLTTIIRRPPAIPLIGSLLVALLLVSTACTSLPSAPPPARLTLVDDICTRLKHDQLTEMTGQTIRLAGQPTNRPDHIRACEYRGGTDSGSNTTLKIDTVVFATTAEAEQALPVPSGTPAAGPGHGVLPGIGDYATYNYQSGLDFSAYLLYVRESNAYLYLDLVLRGEDEHDRGRVENIVTGYARQIFDMLGS